MKLRNKNHIEREDSPDQIRRNNRKLNIGLGLVALSLVTLIVAPATKEEQTQTKLSSSARQYESKIPENEYQVWRDVPTKISIKGTEDKEPKVYSGKGLLEPVSLKVHSHEFGDDEYGYVYHASEEEGINYLLYVADPYAKDVEVKIMSANPAYQYEGSFKSLGKNQFVDGNDEYMQAVYRDDVKPAGDTSALDLG